MDGGEVYLVQTHLKLNGPLQYPALMSIPTQWEWHLLSDGQPNPRFSMMDSA